jgi:hypothetical protein
MRLDGLLDRVDFKVVVLLGLLLPVAVYPARSEVPDTVDYFSYVNWDYRHRNDLVGWKNTSILIQASFRQWGCSVLWEKLENSDASQLTQFQQQIRSLKSSSLRVIYMASHQTPSGRFDFPNEEKAFWSDEYEASIKDSGGASILLLDACHAGVIPAIRMQGKIPFNFLLSASAPAEETYELRMFARRPVDFRRRYPAEVRWMQETLGPKWKGQVSFMGFIWVRQFLKNSKRPVTDAEWQIYLRGMETEAQTFARERSRYLSSTLKLWK